MMDAGDLREYLGKLGLPWEDCHGLPTSPERFPDGAHFRTEELATDVEQYERIFAACDSWGVTVNRITDVRGVVFDTDRQLAKKLEIARERGCEVIMAPGAGETPYDIGQQAQTSAIVQGKIRGMDQLVYALRSMLRAASLGCRGFIVYDEGLLLVALEMRREGQLPPETRFKVSANWTIGNAAAARFWFRTLRAEDCLNPARDLTLPMIAAMRQVAANPLDVHIFHKDSLSRIDDAPEIIRVGAPVYLKNARFGPGIVVEDRVAMCARVVETLERYYPEARQSHYSGDGLAIPARAGAEW